MNLNQTNQQKQLFNLIQFSKAQLKYPQTIQLSAQFLNKFPNSSHHTQVLYLQAQAYSQLDKNKQCLETIQSYTQKTETSETKHVKNLKILQARVLIQQSKYKEANDILNQLIQQNQQVKQIIQLKQSIKIFTDKYSIHQITQQQNQTISNMKIWLSKNGASFPKLKIVNLQPGYRGVISTKHIKKRQTIVHIPKNQLITLEMAKNNHFSQILINRKVKLQSPKHTYMSILLLELKNAGNSKFQTYIDLLPTDETCFPINYSTPQLQMLEGSPFLNMILEKVLDLKKDYDSITAYCPQFSAKYTFKDFCWARMMIGSRIFGITISGIKTQVLVPFADMLNHRQPKQTVWNYQQSINAFVIQSLEDIQVGQQVFDSYGRKCNSRFLLNYGFILENNDDNEIAIKISIDHNDPLAVDKNNMIGSKTTYTEIKKICLNMNNNKFYELMGILRFICVNSQQTLDMLKKISSIEITKQPYVMTRTPPISVQNQTAVWEKLLSLCQEQLSQYKSTLDFDRMEILNKKLTYNERNILHLRIGEKHLLTEYIKRCKGVMNILKSQKLIQILSKNSKQPYARYLYKILTLTPGINKKNLQKTLSSYFDTQTDQNNVDEMEEVAEN